jgi:hypothetical protein
MAFPSIMHQDASGNISAANGKCAEVKVRLLVALGTLKFDRNSAGRWNLMKLTPVEDSSVAVWMFNFSSSGGMRMHSTLCGRDRSIDCSSLLVTKIPI